MITPRYDPHHDVYFATDIDSDFIVKYNRCTKRINIFVFYFTRTVSGGIARYKKTGKFNNEIWGIWDQKDYTKHHLFHNKMMTAESFYGILEKRASLL